MIGRFEEYEKMFRLEGQLWWYRSLHERVAAALQQRAGNRRDVSILDAGCGTGGLLDFLRRKGYTHLRGVDGSVDAVEFCHSRDLPVSLVNLTNLTDLEPDQPYDFIICNDVFCYFDDTELTKLLTGLTHRLKPGGTLISNNNAFAIFWGQHDLAVGSQRRFVLADFKRLMPGVGLRMDSGTYWSFALSPLILLMRQWQSLQLTLGWRKLENAQSDVYMPSAWLNQMLYQVVHTEQKLLSRTPFGSSLFITACKV